MRWARCNRIMLALAAVGSAVSVAGQMAGCASTPTNPCVHDCASGQFDFSGFQDHTTSGYFRAGDQSDHGYYWEPCAQLSSVQCEGTTVTTPVAIQTWGDPKPPDFPESSCAVLGDASQVACTSADSQGITCKYTGGDDQRSVTLKYNCAENFTTPTADDVSSLSYELTMAGPWACARPPSPKNWTSPSPPSPPSPPPPPPPPSPSPMTTTCTWPDPVLQPCKHSCGSAGDRDLSAFNAPPLMPSAGYYMVEDSAAAHSYYFDGCGSVSKVTCGGSMVSKPSAIQTWGGATPPDFPFYSCAAVGDYTKATCTADSKTLTCEFKDGDDSRSVNIKWVCGADTAPTAVSVSSLAYSITLTGKAACPMPAPPPPPGPPECPSQRFFNDTLSILCPEHRTLVPRPLAPTAEDCCAMCKAAGPEFCTSWCFSNDVWTPETPCHYSPFASLSFIAQPGMGYASGGTAKPGPPAPPSDELESW